MRFSFVPRGSRTPRRYRCQPDLGIKLALREALEADPALTPAEQDAIRAFVAGWLRPVVRHDASTGGPPTASSRRPARSRSAPAPRTAPRWAPTAT